MQGPALQIQMCSLIWLWREDLSGLSTRQNDFDPRLGRKGERVVCLLSRLPAAKNLLKEKIIEARWEAVGEAAGDSIDRLVSQRLVLGFEWRFVI